MPPNAPSFPRRRESKPPAGVETNKRVAGRLKDLADVESLTPPADEDSSAATPHPSE